ncbi:hypothetical protein [Streptomyces anulatus]|uniref:hypothetical protein n=1 Tax=Streptomyces anulatus TaxID=1892 RepID=UPI002F907708
MIPAAHRTKGGAPVLGANRPGLSGPFGPYGSDTDEEDDEPGQESAAPPDDHAVAGGQLR